MKYSYSFKDYNKENMARAIGMSLPISFKQSIEICNFIRNKNVNYAKQTLTDVIKEKQIVPFRRFNSDTGHKKEIASGRYPKKASKEILDIINVVEANAQFKGLSTSNLMITHINANKATTVTHFGRKRNRKAKRTNIEIVVQEKTEKKKSGEKKQLEKKEKTMQESKEENKPQENKKLDEKKEAKVVDKEEKKNKK